MAESEITSNDVDTVFSWESETDLEPNKCRMRIYWITWEKAVVLATDLTDNPGCKIANVTKELIHFTSHIYDLAPCKIMLVEHYSSNEFLDEDIYLQVLLTNNEVIRQKIDKSKLIELIGEVL